MGHFKLSNMATRFNRTAEITISDTPKRDMSYGYKEDTINVKQSTSNESIKKEKNGIKVTADSWLSL